MKVIRKTLTGTSEGYTFDVPVVQFLVKNFSDNDILVNFENIVITNEPSSIKIPAGTAQLVIDNEYGGRAFKTIYIKGTGEVEVQALLW